MPGIGLAIARYLASQSQNVVVLARSKDLLDKLSDEFPGQVSVLAGDMNDLSIAQKAVDLAVHAFGGLDGVIINHGTMDPVARIENCKPEEWGKLLNINVISAVAFVRHKNRDL